MKSSTSNNIARLTIAIVLGVLICVCPQQACAETSYRGTVSTNNACPAGNTKVSCGPNVWGCFPDGSPGVCCSCDIDENKCLGCSGSSNCPGDLDPDSYCISEGLSTALLIIAIVIPIVVVAIIVFIIVLCCCCLASAASGHHHRDPETPVVVVQNPPPPTEAQVVYGPDGTAYVQQQPHQKVVYHDRY